MDKLTTDTKESKITFWTKLEAAVDVFLILVLLFELSWGLAYLFSAILHALGENGFTWTNIRGYFISLWAATSYIVFKYYLPRRCYKIYPWWANRRKSLPKEKITVVKVHAGQSNTRDIPLSKEISWSNSLDVVVFFVRERGEGCLPVLSSMRRRGNNLAKRCLKPE